MIIKSIPAIALTLAVSCFAQAAANPKGIFLDSGDASSSAIKFSVLLERDGVRKVVPAGYAFQSGDKMKFQFELNHDRYIYILLRSVNATPALLEQYSGKRGIDVMREEDQRATVASTTTTTTTTATTRTAGGYQLLYPTQQAGTGNKVAARTTKTVPGGDATWFRMDKKPGMEKLLVVVSDKPLDFSPFFETVTGKLRANSAVSVQLSQRLVDYSDNSQISSSRGIEVESYASAAVAAKPMLVPVDLRHGPGK